MFSRLLQQLTLWRNEQATKEGVELFRVLPNKVLEELARTRPRNKAEMVAIKGIKENKFNKYGREILHLIRNAQKRPVGNADVYRRTETLSAEPPQLWGVSDFLDRLNASLGEWNVRVQGEIGSVDERERVVYFTLKDPRDESSVNCFIFNYQYEIIGTRLVEGMEVVVEGVAEIYKPYGRLSLRVMMVELKGEGALKKEYDALKAKLEAEGIFAAENKRSLSPITRHIGLITSRDGAALGDFMTNLKSYGFYVHFMNSSVEGKRAVLELLAAVAYFKHHPVDALIIIRGGGSLESLQAFNHETLVRAIKELPFPVLCGVGHERDVSLLALASDVMVSTPTAAAESLNRLWEEKLMAMRECEHQIYRNFTQALNTTESLLRRGEGNLNNNFTDLMDRIEYICHNLLDLFAKHLQRRELQSRQFFYAWQMQTMTNWQQARQNIETYAEDLHRQTERFFIVANEKIEVKLNFMEKYLLARDPEQQLRMGYSIVSRAGKSVCSVADLHAGDSLQMRFWDGAALSEVKSLRKFKR